MPQSLLIVLAILIAIGIVVLSLFYVRFTATPEAQWARKVRAAAQEQNERINSARTDLSRLDRNDDARKLREEYLQRYLGGIAVEELIRFPGIGPATTSRVRDAGLTNLSALLRANLSVIPGIGPARGTELLKAIRQLRTEAESRFDAGACSEAVAFKEELKRHETNRQLQRRKAEHEIKMAERAIASFEEVRRVARNVSYFNFLRRLKPPELTDEFMSRPLTIPDEPLPEPTPVVTSLPIAVVQTPAIEATPLERLQAATRFGYAVAKADGRVAASERKQIRAFVERRYAITMELAARLESVIADAEKDIPALHEAITRIKRAIPAEAWPELYQFAVSVADAAGERNTREIECLARVAEELGIGVQPAAPAPASPVVASQREPDGPLTETACRFALEIATTTPLSVDLIRRQYRLLSDRFAPEKFASHGPEFVKMAAEKRSLVERAARRLLTEYNEPLEPPAAAPPTDLRHNPDLDDVFGA